MKANETMRHVICAGVLGLAACVSASAQTASQQTAVSSRATAADSWGSVPTKKASVANVAPALLPFFNNGPVFGLPGTDAEISALALN